MELHRYVIRERTGADKIVTLNEGWMGQADIDD